MITPMARSMTLPRNANFLNSSIMSYDPDRDEPRSPVMAELVPAIHVFLKHQDVGARHKARMTQN
jgi:hypothetical protein